MGLSKKEKKECKRQYVQLMKDLDYQEFGNLKKIKRGKKKMRGTIDFLTTNIKKSAHIKKQLDMGKIVFFSEGLYKGKHEWLS